MITIFSSMAILLCTNNYGGGRLRYLLDGSFTKVLLLRTKNNDKKWRADLFRVDCDPLSRNPYEGTQDRCDAVS